MSANPSHVRLLFRPRLLTVSGFPTSYVAWENRRFDPPNPSVQEVWARETLLIASERRTSTGFVESLGQYRVDLFTPVGVGTKTVETLAKEVKDTFAAGTTIRDANAQVHVYRAEALGGRADPGPTPLWYMMPVLLYWRLFTPTSSYAQVTSAVYQIIDYSDGIASKAVDTDWLGADVVSAVASGGTMLRIFVVMAATTRIKVVDDLGTEIGLRDGKDFNAGQSYSVDLPISPLRTYNIQNVDQASAISSLILWELDGGA